MIEIVYFPKLCPIHGTPIRLIRVDSIKKWYCGSCVEDSLSEVRR